MDGAADVHSVEALLEWHAALCVFQAETQEALASVALEIQRSDAWLDERLHDWQREARAAEEEVVRCKAELANRRTPDYSGRTPDCSVQEENLWAAKRRLEIAHDQMEVVRRWYHRLPKLINEAYDGPARRLSSMMEADLPRGLAMLKNQIRSLEAYLNLHPEQVPAPPPAPSKEPT